MRTLQHVWNATRYSLQGLRACWQYELAFRIEVILTLLVIPGIFYLIIDPTRQAILIASWMVILMLELMNSAIEAIVDRISEEHHALSGRAKDLGSAAIFVANIHFVVQVCLAYASLRA